MAQPHIRDLRGGPQHFVLTLAFSPDEQLVASGGADGVLHVWQTATGKEAATAQAAPPYRHVAFSPDGRCLVSTHFDDNIRIWDSRTGKLLCTIPMPSIVQQMAPQDGANPGQNQATSSIANSAGFLLPRTVFTPDSRHLLLVSGNNNGGGLSAS